MQPKAVEAAHPEPEREKDYSARIHGAISSYSSSIMSIGELFRDSQKGVRFPKDLIKVLEQKLQDIAMGKDAAYVHRLSLWSIGGRRYTCTIPSCKQPTWLQCFPASRPKGHTKPWRETGYKIALPICRGLSCLLAVLRFCRPCSPCRAISCHVWTSRSSMPWSGAPYSSTVYCM